MILMEYKQYDEAADLYIYMIEVFNDEGKNSEEFIKTDLSKLVNILTALPNTDENLFNLSKETFKFTCSKACNDIGFPSINFLLGNKLYYSGKGDLVNASERYLFLSDDKNAIEMLVNFEFETYLKENNPSQFGFYLSRIVIPYLLIKNAKFAKISSKLMIKNLRDNDPSFHFEAVKNLEILELNENDSMNDCYKLANFLELLIAIIQRANAENGNNFKLLFKRYQNTLVKYDGLLSKINSLGEIYFQVSVVRKQSNILQDMMGSFLGGGR